MNAFDRLAAALIRRAERIARGRRPAARHRWHSAPYLWPLFAN